MPGSNRERRTTTRTAVLITKPSGRSRRRRQQRSHPTLTEPQQHQQQQQQQQPPSRTTTSIVVVVSVRLFFRLGILVAVIFIITSHYYYYQNFTNTATGNNRNNSNGGSTITNNGLFDFLPTVPSHDAFDHNNKNSIITTGSNYNDSSSSISISIVSTKTKKQKNQNNNQNNNNNQWNHLILHPHPYAGGKDSNGNWGYIANVSTQNLKVQVLSQKTCRQDNNNNNNTNNNNDYNDYMSTRPDKDLEGFGGYRVLQKVKMGLLELRQQQRQKQQSSSSSSSPRILCIVYTHSNRHYPYLQSVIDTWGRQCDGFIASSNLTNPKLNAVNIPHRGIESYNNMWQKIRSTLVYIYTNYFTEEYDYYHVCGDDTYLIVEHLKHYLRSSQIQQILNGSRIQFSMRQQPPAQAINNENDIYTRYTNALNTWKNYVTTSTLDHHSNNNDDNNNPTTLYNNTMPLLLGMPHDRNGDPQVKGDAIYFQTFPGGGSGYTLNKQSLLLFVKECIPNFLPNATNSREDMYIGGCFHDYGIFTVDTRDENGAWLYMSQDAETHSKFGSMVGQKKSMQGGATWLPDNIEKKYGIKSLPGLDGVSKHGIAFHLKVKNISSVDLMYRYHSILHNSNNKC